MTVKIFLASLAMLAMPAFGQDYHLQLHAASVSSGGKVNDFAPGLGVRKQLDSFWALQGGVYRNKVSGDNLYALAQWTPVQVRKVSAGLFGGFNVPVKMGHGETVGGALVRYQGDAASLTLRLAPKTRTTGSGNITVELGWKL